MPTPTSQTVEKTLQLLHLFTNEHPEMTASEISARAGLALSTTFRLLSTLVKLRFLDYDPSTRRYRLGLALLDLGTRVQEQMDLSKIAGPVLRRLAQETRETVHLSIRDGEEGVFIAKVEGLEALRSHTRVGQRVSLAKGASMKILLAYMPEDEIDSYLATHPYAVYASGTRLTADELKGVLSEIRKRGYAISRSEQNVGAAGIAAPIRDHSGEVIAGLTISGPEGRLLSDGMSQLIELVTAGANDISRQLGYGMARPALLR